MAQASTELAKMLAGMKKEIETLKRGSRSSQLGQSSIDADVLETRDINGNITSSWGEQPDGNTAPVYEPTGFPPPRPTTPTLQSVTGGILVILDGKFEAEAERPSNFKMFEIHAAPESEGVSFVPNEITKKTVVFDAENDGGEAVIPADGPMYIRVLSRNLANEHSPGTDGVLGEPGDVVATEILDGIVTEIKLADDAVSAAKVQLGAIDFTKLTNDLQTDINDAVTNAADAITAANDALEAAEGATKVYYQEDAPATPNTGDLWFKVSTGKASRWNGTAWDEITDEDIVAALDAAQSAQTTADGKIVAFRQSTTPTAEGIGDIWIDTGNDNVVKWWDGTTWTTAQVGEAAIADSAISTNKLAALSVVAGKIATDAITADKILANSITTAKLNALAVTADKIASNAITTAKLDALAVTADKIAANAITAGKIAAGEITAAKLASDLILGSRVRLQDAGGNTTVDLNGTTGSAFFRGEVATGSTTNTRIVLNPGNTGTPEIRAYPSNDTTRYSRITASDYTHTDGVTYGRLALASAVLDGTASDQGNITLYPNLVRIQAGPLAAPTAELLANETNLYMTVRNQIWLKSQNSSGTELGSILTTTNTCELYRGTNANKTAGIKVQSDQVRFHVGGDVNANTLKYDLDTNGAPRLGRVANAAGNAGSAMVYGSNTGGLFAVRMDNNADTNFRCATLTQSNPSERRLKKNIRELPFDSLEVINNAPATAWEYIAESGQDPDKTHFGPMVDDLPEELTIEPSDKTAYIKCIDPQSLIPVLWEAVRKLSTKAEEQEKRIQELESRLS